MLENELTRDERRSLMKLAELDGACDAGVLPNVHLVKLIELGLVATERGRYCLTLVGQIHAVRQQFAVSLACLPKLGRWRDTIARDNTSLNLN